MKGVLDRRLALTLVVSMLLHGALLYLLWYDRTPLRTSSATAAVDIRLLPTTTNARPDARPASSTRPPVPTSPRNERRPRSAPVSRTARPPRPATPLPKPPRRPARPARTPPPPSRPVRASAPPARPGPPPPAHAGKPERPAASAPVTTHDIPDASPPKETAGAAALRSRYLGELASAIARNRHYPRLSRRRREEGRVLVGFHIASDGRFEQVRVLESSGQPRLDRAALETVRRTSPFRPPPPALREADREIRLPLVFRLQ